MAQLVGSLLAGPMVDKLDRRRLLIVCDILQMLLGATIPLLRWSTTPGEWGRYAMWLIHPVIAASCILISLSAVGPYAALPQVAGRDDLLRAVHSRTALPWAGARG